MHLRVLGFQLFQTHHVARFQPAVPIAPEPNAVGVNAMLTPDMYHTIIDSLASTPVGIRDAAIIGLVYAGRLRAFDIEALDPEHVTFSRAGLRAELVTAKRPALVLRRLVNPLYCPVALLERWFRLINFTAPGFRAFTKYGIRDTRLS